MTDESDDQLMGELNLAAAAVEESGCPDCLHPWPDTLRPCPGCGLTIEDVSERAAYMPKLDGL